MTLKMKQYASVEDPLNMHRTVSNEAYLISEIPNIINGENFIIAPGKRKIPDSIFSDKFCEEQAFFIFFLWINLAIMLLQIFQ